MMLIIKCKNKNSINSLQSGQAIKSKTILYTPLLLNINKPKLNSSIYIAVMYQLSHS